VIEVKKIISIDDGCQLDLKMAKLCKKYGIEAIFYIPVDYIGLAYQKGYEPLSPTAYSYIVDNFEIGSHGITHDYLTRIPLEQAREEIFESKKMIENVTGKKVTKFCYPRGYFNDDIKTMVKEAGYESARTVAIGHLERGDDLFEEKTTVHIGCPVRPEYKNTTWLDYARNLLKQADEDSVFHAWGHSHEIEKYHEWHNVEIFIKELANG